MHIGVSHLPSWDLHLLFRYPEAEITVTAATSSSQRPASLSLSVALGLSSGMVYIMTADMSG